MKIITFLVLFLLAGAVSLHANSAPVVSDVTAQQRDDGSMIVDIYYDVYDADGDDMTITMQVSADDGNTWNFSCINISGDVGSGVYSGNNKHIVWNLGAEHPNIAGNNFRFRINAYDGVNVDPFDWSFVQAGDYTWGENNQIQNIAYDYMIMTYEVTNSQYKIFLEEAVGLGTVWKYGDYMRCYYPGDDNTAAGEQNIYSLGTPSSYNYARITFDNGEFTINVPSGYSPGDFDDHPVVYVNFFGAWAFAEHYGIRLPTEQEWEKAARGMTGYTYPWGNSLSGDRANYYNSGDPWDNGTTPVGMYNGQTIQGFSTTNSHSPYGVYDMCGNVYDWTDSWYNSDSRVIRGGAWNPNSIFNHFYSWYRYDITPGYYPDNIGFRCCRTP